MAAWDSIAVPDAALLVRSRSGEIDPVGILLQREVAQRPGLQRAAEHGAQIQPRKFVLITFPPTPLRSRAK